MERVDVIYLLDASGSMYDQANETISAFNKSLDDYKDLENVKISVFTFSFTGNYRDTISISEANSRRIHPFTKIDTISKRCHHKDVVKLSKENYHPDGYTPLYDAFCVIAEDMGKTYSELPENDRPTKVIFIMFSDGQENMSIRKFEDMEEIVKHQTDIYKWEFIYVGTDLAGCKTAKGTGTTSYHTGDLKVAYGTVSRAVACYVDSSCKGNVQINQNDLDQQ